MPKTRAACLLATDLLYQELAEIVRSKERPCLRFKDICKIDMKLADVDINSWERISDGRRTWSIVVWGGVRRADEPRWNEITASVQKSSPFLCLNFFYILTKLCTAMSPTPPNTYQTLFVKPARALLSANNNLLTVVRTHVKAEDNSFVVAAAT